MTIKSLIKWRAICEGLPQVRLTATGWLHLVASYKSVYIRTGAIGHMKKSVSRRTTAAASVAALLSLSACGMFTAQDSESSQVRSVAAPTTQAQPAAPLSTSTQGTTGAATPAAPGAAGAPATSPSTSATPTETSGGSVEKINVELNEQFSYGPYQVTLSRLVSPDPQRPEPKYGVVHTLVQLQVKNVSDQDVLFESGKCTALRDHRGGHALGAARDAGPMGGKVTLKPGQDFNEPLYFRVPDNFKSLVFEFGCLTHLPPVRILLSGDKGRAEEILKQSSHRSKYPLTPSPYAKRWNPEGAVDTGQPVTVDNIFEITALDADRYWRPVSGELRSGQASHQMIGKFRVKNLTDQIQPLTNGFCTLALSEDKYSLTHVMFTQDAAPKPPPLPAQLEPRQTLEFAWRTESMNFDKGPQVVRFGCNEETQGYVKLPSISDYLKKKRP